MMPCGTKSHVRRSSQGDRFEISHLSRSRSRPPLSFTARLMFLALLCAQLSNAQQAGSFQDIQITSDGASRTFVLYTPEGWTSQSGPIPLVINFHGWTNSPDDIIDRSQMDVEADEYGWAVAFPEGEGSSFNAGNVCCSPANIQGVDDVQFARDIVDDLVSRMNVDRNAVFATGFSNGGFMSQRIACEAPDLVRGVAPNSGRLDLNNCNPGGPVPMISFQGDSDSTVNIDGRFISLLPVLKTYQEDLEYRLDENGCNDNVVETVQVTSTTSCELYTDCDGDAFVEWCLVEGGGHDWFYAEDGDIDTSAYSFMRFSQILDGTYPGAPATTTTTRATTTTTQATTTTTRATTTTSRATTTTTQATTTTTQPATTTRATTTTTQPATTTRATTTTTQPATTTRGTTTTTQPATTREETTTHTRPGTTTTEVTTTNDGGIIDPDGTTAPRTVPPQPTTRPDFTTTLPVVATPRPVITLRPDSSDGANEASGASGPELTDGSFPMTAVIGGVVVVVLLLIACCIYLCWYRRKRKYQNSVVDDHSLSNYEPSARSPFPAKVTDGNGLIGSSGGAAGVRGATLVKDNTESNGSSGYTNSSASGGSGGSSGTGYVAGAGAGYNNGQAQANYGQHGAGGYNQAAAAGYGASNYSSYNNGGGAGYAASNYSSHTGAGAGAGYAASNYSSHTRGGAGSGYAPSNYSSHTGVGASSGYAPSNYSSHSGGYDSYVAPQGRAAPPPPNGHARHMSARAHNARTSRRETEMSDFSQQRFV